MGLFGLLKKIPKKKWILAKVDFDKDIWPDRSELRTFMSDFGDENEEYEMTEKELLDKDIYHRVYEYTFDRRPITVKEDGTVFLPPGPYSVDDEDVVPVGRIHDPKALEIIRSGSVTKYVPFVEGGPYKELDGNGELIESSDSINFRVYIYYTLKAE